MVFIKNPLGPATPSRVPKYKEGHILPVLGAHELLKSERFQTIINDLRALVNLPQEYFDNLYLNALERFAEFVQLIPIQAFGALSGLLAQGVARAFLAVKAYYSEDKKTDGLMTYAIFTAALMLDVSKALINQKISIVAEKGEFLDDWRPFEGSLRDHDAEFYKMYPVNPLYQRLDQSIKPLLARQLMPSLGFLWIAGDPAIFAEWLDALRDDALKGGTVNLILALVKDEELQQLMRELFLQEYEAEPSIENQHGEEFYKWLKNGLENGEIKTNTSEAGVHVVNEGVLIERKLFKQFSDVYNVPVAMNVVMAQFGNLMGIAAKGGSDFVHQQYFSKYAEGARSGSANSYGALTQASRSMRDGVVVSDASKIFLKGDIPAATNLLKAVESRSSDQQRLPTLQAQVPEFKIK
jgi:hypothetical protein